MKVFISYSWDSEDHKNWVQQFADSIQDFGGLEVIYDQVGMSHQVDRNHFMEQGILASDVVLAIVTKSYAEKANARKGGVGRETTMAAERYFSEIDSSSKTTILVIKRDADADSPNYLRASLYFDFSDNSFYEGSIKKLQNQLEEIRSQAHLKAHTLGDSATPLDEEAKFTFTRTHDLIASFYRVRKPLLTGDASIDFSGQKRIKYELWMVHTPQPQLVLVLASNIVIKQTLEHFCQQLSKLTAPAKDIKALTVLRPTPAQQGYIALQLQQLGREFELTELTFKEYLSTYCVRANGLQFSEPFREPFYIDQMAFLGQGADAKPLGPANIFLVNELQKKTASPLSLLVASGGTGKTTLFRVLASEIDRLGKSKVLLMEIDMLKKLSREEIRRARISSLFDLYQLYVLALSKDGVSNGSDQIVSERALFELLLISGEIVILIDGIDELFSLLHENFHLDKFIQSIQRLHSELGEARVMLASRDDAIATTVHVIRSAGIPIYSLRGFSDTEVASYSRKRFAKRPHLEMERLTQRVMDSVRTVSEGRGGVSVVLPFFVDVLCEIEEDAGVDTVQKMQGTITAKLEDADYPHNNTLIDLLVFSILQRERERQDWTPSVGSLIEVFKELSSSNSGICFRENFDVTVDTFLGASGPAAIERFSKNPLLKFSDNTVTFKYDFLNGYFLALWLLESIEASSASDLVIKHLSKLSQGQGSVFDDLVRYYRQKNPTEIGRITTKIYAEIKRRLSSLNGTAQEPAEQLRAACSAICQLVAATVKKGLSRSDFSTLIFNVAGFEVVSGKRRVTYLNIHGEFPVLYFENIEVWNSEFIGYESFSKCRFDNTKFYYSTFLGIEGLNKSPSFSMYIFDRASCSIGELAYLFDVNSNGSDANTVSIDEFKKFFKYFFVGGVFNPKSLKDFYKFSVAGVDEEIVQDLIAKNILVHKPAVGSDTYEIKPIHQRMIQKFVNENTLNRELRAIVKPWTAGSLPNE